MAKTVFNDGNPTATPPVKGTKVTAEFLNALQNHVHDGADADGHAPKVDADMLDGKHASAESSGPNTIVARDNQGNTVINAIGLGPGVGGGIHFPNDAFGGGGDTASITLLNPGGSADRTELTIKVTNDATGVNEDTINLVATDSMGNENPTGVRINGHVAYHDGNKAGFYVPIGSVFYFAASSPPLGYLLCDGSEITKGVSTIQGQTADFSALCDVIGYNFSNGANKYMLPKLGDDFIRSASSTRPVGTRESDAIKSHTHHMGQPWPMGDGTSPGMVPDAGGGLYTGTQSDGTTETRPRNVALSACIKY